MTSILFVDDDYLTLETCDKIFSLFGYDVLLADSGETAFERASGREVDLIILDVRLPRVDGFDLLELLKSNPLTSKIPVVMTSANPKSYAEKAIASGAQYYISKPIYPEQIEKILAELENGEKSL